MSFYNDPMFMYSNTNTTDTYSDISERTKSSEININQAKVIKKILDENAKLWQELNDAKYAISLLEKQMSGLRTKLAKIEKNNTFDRPIEYTTK